MSLDNKTESNSGGTEGRYANHLKIGCNAFEFVMDFAQYFPENGMTTRCARIITGPVYAKAFLETLRETVARYENEHGDIESLTG